ncbi:MAG: hypothetical protein A3F84_04965 [Candidatus Handelsmanbacteria bacterium RIFCSPLOWO2_12_FULL_64_10]|uniref:Uncharacterized protein n=1 Tax=Handelsmanbacteria sp. (strain RIFCSPLOWO2_12_FULL_64_10) TaxID=1817868 RepID=A0A1F6CQQ3_HANXR|nr:MAG: hypothetical protein A3F84_04965 [Candidatus Handelsmanbacteria bacterium RIFCSPLOWO2_12_FULL_64_10]
MSQPIDLSYLSLYLFIEDRRKPGQKYLDPDFEQYRSIFEARMHANSDEFFGVGNNTHSDGGVGLIGRRADYIVRNADERPMFWYRRRLPLEGDNRKRLRDGLRDLLTMAEGLAAEPRLEGAVTFRTDRLRAFVDRSGEVPNTDEALQRLLPDLEPVARTLYGGGVKISRVPFGGRLGAEVAGPAGLSVRQMLENLGQGKGIGN